MLAKKMYKSFLSHGTDTKKIEESSPYVITEKVSDYRESRQYKVAIFITDNNNEPVENVEEFLKQHSLAKAEEKGLSMENIATPAAWELIKLGFSPEQIDHLRMLFRRERSFVLRDVLPLARKKGIKPREIVDLYEAFGPKCFRGVLRRVVAGDVLNVDSFSRIVSLVKSNPRARDYYSVGIALQEAIFR